MANLRKTTPQFVEEAQWVHGENFDYSEVEYVNTHTPVMIKCRQCGAFFMQEPTSLLAGCGCPKCSKKTISQEAFIAGARKVHGDIPFHTHTTSEWHH
jgi:Zn finger protein HypA/HybF involved in hydrogenase expression